MIFKILSPFHRATRQISLYLGDNIKDLESEEGHALSYIAQYGPCPTGDIQRVIGARRSTITSMLNRLCDKGLVLRERDPNDARVLLLTVTKSGRKLAQKGELVALALENDIMSRLQAKDIAVFMRVVEAVELATGVTVVNRDNKS